MYVGEDISDVGQARSVQVIAGEGTFTEKWKPPAKAKGTLCTLFMRKNLGFHQLFPKN